MKNIPYTSIHETIHNKNGGLHWAVKMGGTPEEEEQINKYGFKSEKCPSQNNTLALFENDLYKMA